MYLFSFYFLQNGDVSQLPIDSCPIDFAFNIHTQVGLKCTAAKINGKIVPLNTELKNGDTVKIVSSKLISKTKKWKVYEIIEKNNKL